MGLSEVRCLAVRTPFLCLNENNLKIIHKIFAHSEYSPYICCIGNEIIN